ATACNPPVLFCFPSRSFFFFYYGLHFALHSFPTRRSSDLFDAYPKFFACLVRFESSSVPTTLPTAYDVYPLDGRNRRRLKADRKSGSAGMPRPISYAVFCLKKKMHQASTRPQTSAPTQTSAAPAR